MLDGSYFFECKCGSNEHTLRFVVDKENNELYTHVFLNQYRNFLKRLWIGIKYIFGYKCCYGHWDEWIMIDSDIKKMRKMLDEFEK